MPLSFTPCHHERLKIISEASSYSSPANFVTEGKAGDVRNFNTEVHIQRKQTEDEKQ